MLVFQRIIRGTYHYGGGLHPDSAVFTSILQSQEAGQLVISTISPDGPFLYFFITKSVAYESCATSDLLT